MKLSMKCIGRRIIYLVLGVLLSFNLALAQNEYPSNDAVLLDGYSINIEVPDKTGGWSRGINFFNYDGTTKYGGIAIFGNDQTAERIYMAYGQSPWSSGLGMYIKPDGSIGIGTTNPTERLTVNGTTKAEEVIVTENVGADFVFEEDYDLQQLNEVEVHIKQHNHLPDIPSAEEMKRSGVKVGDLQMKLLQKIEELMLYVIEQNKQNKQQQELIQQQQKQIEHLKRLVNQN